MAPHATDPHSETDLEPKVGGIVPESASRFFGIFPTALATTAVYGIVTATCSPVNATATTCSCATTCPAPAPALLLYTYRVFKDTDSG